MSDPKAPITSKRPDPKQYTKWEKPLPFHLEEFMDAYWEWKNDGVQHPEWKQPKIEEFESDLHGFIKLHFKASSKTRLAFGNMTSAEVWQDEKNKIMHLTKRNLATLDPKFIPTLSDHIIGCLKEDIMVMRKEADAVLDAIYASEDERREVAAVTSGTDDLSFTLVTLGQHVEQKARLRKELGIKFAVIEFLRMREQFVQKLVHFEARFKGTAKTPSKGSNNVLIWLPKWRSDAAKHLLQSNDDATQMIETYFEQSGKAFMMNDRYYLPDFLEHQKAQVAKVKTNFAYITDEVLFFDNPAGGEEGGPIVPRVFDEELLGSLLADGIPVRDNLPMPEFSDELLFTFEYC